MDCGTAHLFAREGAKVAVTGRSEARAQAVVDRIKEEGGGASMGFMKDRSPLHRVAQGSEIASVALFLAMKDSAFIDGQLIRVDGGVDI